MVNPLKNLFIPSNSKNLVFDTKFDFALKVMDHFRVVNIKKYKNFFVISYYPALMREKWSNVMTNTGERPLANALLQNTHGLEDQD